MKFKIKRMAKTLLSMITAAALFSAAIPVMQTTTSSAASNVVVDISKEYQEIRGFGGMNHPEWVGDLTESQRETAFGNDEDDLGFSVLRIFINEDKNQWYKTLDTAKSAIAHGAIVFASPWNPPSDMTETFTRNGVEGEIRLRHDKYAEYAQYLNDFVSYMSENGVELYAISVQNEPDYAEDWTWWTPEEMLDFMKNYADEINCRVIAPESFQYLKNMSDPILNDEEALSNMEILGTHFYGTSVSNMEYPLFDEKGSGKELWMTEVYLPNSEADSSDRWPESLEVAYNMHSALINDFQTYVWWYIRRSYGPMKEDGTISKRGYCMAQYSKFVRPGYQRVDATVNPESDVYVSAYKGDDNKVVIVAINNGTAEVSQNFVISDGTISNVDRYRTSSTESLAKTASMTASADSFWSQLPAQSVSTFVIDLSVSADENGYYFHDTFEDGLGSWQIRGSGLTEIESTQAYAGDNCMLISGRTAAWNGAEKSLSTMVFVPGNKYSFSAVVKTEQGNAAETFRLTLQYKDADDVTNYLHIAESDALKGEYVQLANTSFQIPENATDLRLIVETADATVDFYVDEIIGAADGTVIEGPEMIEVMRGDVNSDGKINAFDVLLAKSGNIYGYSSSSIELAADVNEDGNSDTEDISNLKQFVLNKLMEFNTSAEEILADTE